MPPALLQYIPLAALGISLLALFVSFANLGWNMYRELALRGRLTVSFGIRQFFHESFPKPLTRVCVSGTNFGPGSVRVSMISYRKAGMWRRILRRVEVGTIIHDYSDPLSGKLPAKLEVGDSIDLLLKYGPEFEVPADVTDIGLSDSFGHIHWAPRRSVRTFRTRHEKDFPKKRPNTALI
jgi:hypothetical protein